MGEWREYYLRELVRDHNSSRWPVKSTDRIPGDVPYYGASGVVDWVDGYTHDGRFLLVAEDGENLRSRSTPVAFLVNGRVWVNNHAHVLSGIEEHDTRFLGYALAVTDISGYLTGSAQPKLSKSAMESIRLYLPPSNERRAIAEVLGALDDKIAANERIARTAIELADSLFAAGQSSADGRATVGELVDRGIVEVGDGYRTKRAEHGQPGLKILRAGDVRDFQLFPDGNDFVSEDYSRQIGKKASQPGDVVMTTKGTVGRVAFVSSRTEQVVYSPQICYFRIIDPNRLHRGYLAAWFRSNDLRAQTGSLMYKSDMAPYINLRDIRSLSVPMPDLAEQQQRGEEQLALLNQFDANGVENESLARTRDELLPLLMSGKIRVKDAEATVSEVL